MPDDIVLRPQGRVSEPSPDAAPPGSMLVAENVTIREEGIVRHLGNSTIISGSFASDGIWNISPQFDNGATPGQLCYAGDANGTSAGVAMSGALGTEIQYTDVDGTATTVQYFDHGDGESMPPMYIARDNLYLSDQRGMYKLTDTDGATLERVWDAGWMSVRGTNAGAGTAIASGNWVGYRLVAVMEDPNGVITRSAPSVSTTYYDDSPAAGDVDLDIAISEDFDNAASFRGIEVYRTRQYANPIVLPNEYFLIREILAPDFASGSSSLTASITDSSSDDELNTAALYTNSSQGGEAAANIAPPEHLYHASFRGHEFWGNVSQPEFFHIEVTVSTPLQGSDIGLGSTSGSPNVTFTNAQADRTGSLVTEATSLFGNQAIFVESYPTTTSGVMSEDATATGSSDYSYDETLFIRYGDGTTDRISLLRATDGSGGSSDTWSGNNWAEGDAWTAPQNSYVFWRDMIPDGLGRTKISLIIASRKRTARQGVAQAWIGAGGGTTRTYTVEFADLATAGGSGSPTTGGTEAEQAYFPAGLMWSKFQEPEHTTLGNFVEVGNASGIGGGQIVGLGALREALIIVKTDGIFRLTGDRGNWRIDPLDTSVRMIGGRSVQVMDNQVYALSERGVVRITAQGVTDLTDGIVGDWFGEAGLGTHRAGDIREYMLENDGYHPPLLQAAVDTTNREYVLMAEGTRGGDTGGKPELLVFNAKTGSFTTWDIAGTENIAAIAYARGDYSGTAEQYPGIVYSGYGEDSSLYLIQNQRGVSGSNFPVELRFRARTEADPTHVKLWTDAVWQMVPGGATRTGVACIFQASEEGSDESVAVSNDGGTRQIRCWIPRGAARSDELVAGISGDNVSVRGFRLTFRSSGRRAPVSND